MNDGPFFMDRLNAHQPRQCCAEDGRADDHQRQFQHDVYAFSDQPALQFGVQVLVALLLVVPDDRHAPANTAHDIAGDRGRDFPPADVVMSISTLVGDGEHGFGLLGKCLHYGLVG